MTVIEAIQEADRLKPNMFPLSQKIKWLSRLDQRIFREIISTHEYNDGEEEIAYPEYGDPDSNSDLLVGEPYAEMYVHWLEAQIDYNNMEYDGFNASNAMFEAVYSRFRNAYNEEHMPLAVRKNYF